MFCAPPQDQPEATEAQKQLEEEADIMKHVLQKAALKAVKELAQDVVYTKSMATGWKPPLRYRLMPEVGGFGVGLICFFLFFRRGKMGVALGL